MKINVFFSIIIPLHNKSKYILNTLNSALNQTYSHFEIIVINDGSTDNSVDLINSLNSPKIRLISQENQGVSVARNKGIKIAKGNYIAFLDADDYWFPFHLAEIKKSITKFPNESVFCNNYNIYLTKEKFKKTTFSIKPSSEEIILITNYFESSLINSIAWTSSVCLKKSIIDKTLLFDKNLSSGQDTDLWIRLGLKYPFIFNKRITSNHLKYIENSLSKGNTVKSRYHFTLKYLNEEKSNPFLKKFMDNNRFAIALNAKKKNDLITLSKVKSEIDYKNLNLKQKLLLNIPKLLLSYLDKIKFFLFKKNINILIYN